MNRDENLAREKGLPPAMQRLNGRTALFPSEPGTGTWIGLNDAGATFALINWYSVAGRIARNVEFMSRGAVTRHALEFDSAAAVNECLSQLPLQRIKPFRLIGVIPVSREVVEWRWDLDRLKAVPHEWRTNIWISSGYDEPGAQQTRLRAFRKALREAPAESEQWLHSLHSSHRPGRGPYSICMHRSDAATVSYTEITVTREWMSVAYAGGSPCSTAVGQAQKWRTGAGLVSPMT